MEKQKNRGLNKKSVKIIAFSFIAVMVFGVTFVAVGKNNARKASAAYSYSGGEFVYVTASSLNIRTGPGTSYSSIGTVPKDTILFARNDAGCGNWVPIEGYKQNTSNGKYVYNLTNLYVSKSYVTCMGDEDNIMAYFPLEDVNVNIRELPGTSKKSINIIDKDGFIIAPYNSFTLTRNGYKWKPVIEYFDGDTYYEDFKKKIVANYYIHVGYWTADKYYSLTKY